MATIARRAPAKVNLALSVGPPAPADSPHPGWHPICTWMHAIDLADDVEVSHANGPSRYEIAWAPDAPRPSRIDWPVEADLAFRAHRLLERHAGRVLPVHVRIAKRIPVGGGLGGGSSDAAAVLLAVRDLFGPHLSLEHVRDMSGALGSDVAFFIDEDDPPRPAIVSGFGDCVERLAGRRSERLVLLVPDFGCSTPAVYRASDESPRALRGAQVRALAASGPLAGLFNDLDGPAAAVEPRLAALRACLEAALGAPVHMTGSGSTLFVVAPTDAGAHDMAARAAGVAGIAPVVSRLV